MRAANPLSRILGTLVIDEPWIYVDPLLRNPEDLDHSQLFGAILIGNIQYQYGERGVFMAGGTR